MNNWWLLPTVAALSFALTALTLRVAGRGKMLDVPNERSSHFLPTPRGGGLGIVVSFLLVLPWLWYSDVLPGATSIALLGGGGGVALVGFIDDLRGLSARTRLIAHFAAAAWALYWLGGAPADAIPASTPVGGMVAVAVAAVYVVWLLNLYNFMDGIDGIAAIEAVTVCIGAAVLYALVSPSGPDWLTPAALAAASAGFLAWNYPPARIFLGDVGSGFLGVVLAVLSIEAGHAQPALLCAWSILLAVFVVDATTTLLRRVVRGARIYEAHRTHAYQHAARKLGSHRVVSLTVGAVNLLWLCPIALLVGTGRLAAPLGVLAAYVPLIAIAVYLQAGLPESAGRTLTPL